MRWLSAAWPWYVAGPLIGLVVPLLLWLGNKPFGSAGGITVIAVPILSAVAGTGTYGLS